LLAVHSDRLTPAAAFEWRAVRPD